MVRCKQCGVLLFVGPKSTITVRLDKSLHDFLLEEAHNRHVSLNKHCIDKLARSLEGEDGQAFQQDAVSGDSDGRLS